MLRKIISIIFICSAVFILIYDIKDVKDYEKKVDSILENDSVKRKYEGYISYLDKKLLIKTGDNNEVLDSNLVLMMNSKELIKNKTGNIVLAGHNNKYVFSSLYNLKENDQVILSDFDNDYIYNVYKREYINIKDKEVLDNVYDKKILTLITCTSNNQIRYIIICKFDHMVPHK